MEKLMKAALHTNIHRTWNIANTFTVTDWESCPYCHHLYPDKNSLRIHIGVHRKGRIALMMN